MILTEELAEVFVEAADTSVDRFDLIDFLDMVTTRTGAISQATAVGLLLADPHGRLQFMAASQESAKLLELFQVQNSEGPCQDCFRTGIPVVNAELDQATPRWPRFAPRAVAAGFHSVHAFPLRHQHRVIGALNLFGGQSGRLDPADTRLVQAWRTSPPSEFCNSRRSVTVRSSPSSSKARSTAGSSSNRPKVRLPPYATPPSNRPSLAARVQPPNPSTPHRRGRGRRDRPVHPPCAHSPCRRQGP